MRKKEGGKERDGYKRQRGDQAPSRLITAATIFITFWISSSPSSRSIIPGYSTHTDTNPRVLLRRQIKGLSNKYKKNNINQTSSPPANKNSPFSCVQFPAVRPWSKTKRRRDYYEALPLLVGDQVKIERLKGRFIKKYNRKIGHVHKIFGEDLFEVALEVPDGLGSGGKVIKKLRVKSKHIGQVYSAKREESQHAAVTLKTRPIYTYRMSRQSQYSEIGIRAAPMAGAKRRSGTVGADGSTFDVDRVMEGDNGQVFLHLANGKGWAFTKDPVNVEETIAVCVGVKHEKVPVYDQAFNITRNKYHAAKYQSVPLHLLEENKPDYVSEDDDSSEVYCIGVCVHFANLRASLEEVESMAKSLAKENAQLQDDMATFGPQIKKQQMAVKAAQGARSGSAALSSPKRAAAASAAERMSSSLKRERRGVLPGLAAPPESPVLPLQGRLGGINHLLQNRLMGLERMVGSARDRIEEGKRAQAERMQAQARRDKRDSIPLLPPKPKWVPHWIVQKASSDDDEKRMIVQGDKNK
eukprot:jgi/Bigna1/77047/fgenesh1_pg.45_\